MALNAGEVLARIGFRFDETDADKFDRRYDKAQAKAQKGIRAEAKIDFDERGVTRFEQAMARIERRAGGTRRGNAGVDVDTGSFRAAEQGFEAIAGAAGGAGNAVRGVTVQAGFFSGALGKVAAIAAVAAPALVALAGAAGALIGSLAAATAGAAALGIGLGGILVPIGAIGAAVKARFGPIGDAIDALSKQEDAATKEGTAAAKAQQGATDALRAAKWSLADAQRNVTRVQRDLTAAQREARQELDDLTTAAERADLSQRRAAISLKEAIDNLGRIQSDPQSSRLDVESAKLAVDEARQSAKEARDNAKDATRARREAADAGVEGSARVKAAEEQVADAKRARARAEAGVAAAQRDSATAGDTQSASANAAAIALGKLSGAERKFVDTWRRVSKDITEALQPATDAIVSSLTRAVDRGGKIVQKLAKPFEDLGDAIGAAIDHATERLGGEKWVGAISQLTTAAADLVMPVSDILLSVLGILRDIAVAAIPFVEDFVKGVDEGLGGIAEKTGDISNTRGVIKDLLDHTKEWVHFLGAVAELFFVIFQGGADDGKSLLKYLTDIVERWTAFLETKEGQKRLKDFFHDSVQLAKRMADSIIAAVDAIGGIAIKVNGAIAAFDRWRESTQGVRHFLRLVWNIITLDYPDALDALKDLFWDLLPSFTGFGRAVRNALDDAFDTLKRKTLNAIRSILDIAEELPGVGGKFRRLKDDVDAQLRGLAAEEHTEKFRENLRKVREANDDTRASFRRLKRDTTIDLKDIAQATNERAEEIKSDLGSKSRAGKLALAANFREAIDAVRLQMKRGVVGTKEGMEAIRGYLVAELQVYGLSLRQAKSIASGRSISGGRENTGSGDRTGAQRGGWITGKGLVGADTVPIAPGVIAAPGEWHGVAPDGTGVVVNRHQAPFAEAALAITQAMGGAYGSLTDLGHAGIDQPSYLHNALHAAGLGGLDALFGAVTRPHAMQRGGIVPVPGFPGERANRSILDEIAYVTRRFKVILTDAFGPGHKSPGHTVTGTAADFAGPDRNMDAAVRWAASQGYVVGYDGRFGSKQWPGHGPSAVAGTNAHLHVEFGTKNGKVLPAIAAAVLPRIRIRGGGAVGRATQRALDVGRAGATSLLSRAGAAGLEAPVAGGGRGADPIVIGSFRQAIRLLKANPAERLALWEAGLVESGLKNLNFGDADSLGALQERVSIYGRAHALDPLASAMRFLRGAIALRPWRSTPGLLAAAVQRPAAQFRGRYDAARGQAARFMQRGGGHGRPSLDEQVASAIGDTGPTRLSIRGLRNLITGRNTEYTGLVGRLAVQQRDYTATDREYNLSDETLVDPKTGLVDTEAVDKRAGELDRLAAIRRDIEHTIEQMQTIATRVIRTYRTIIGRLTRSLRHAKKKNRRGIRAQIRGYNTQMGEWQDKFGELGLDLRDARLDTSEIIGEAAEVRGTQKEDRATDTAAETSPNQEAIANAAVARATALAQDLAATRANFSVFSGTGDLGTGLGGNAFASAARDTGVELGAGTGGYALGPNAKPATGGGTRLGGVAADGTLTFGENQPIVIVNQQNLVPGSTEVMRATGDAVATALEGRAFTPTRTERVG